MHACRPWRVTTGCLLAVSAALACSESSGPSSGPSADRLVLVSGNSQIGQTGGALAAPLIVRAEDSTGVPLPNVQVTWTVTDGGGSITPASSVTDNNGVAQAQWTLGPSAGTNSAVAMAPSSGSLFGGATADSVLFTATGQVIGGGGTLTFRYVNAGSYHVCGITLGEQAFCWGFNGDGQLGDSSLVNTNAPVPVTGGLTFRQVSGGRYHTCGVTLSNIGYCWGANVAGQLGIGSLTTTAPEPTPNKLALTFINKGAGLQHTCALSHTGVAFCWGWNLEFELGWASTHVTADTANFVFQGPADTLLSAIGVGGLHTCGLVEFPFALRGRVICWGSNLSGQLGNGATSFSSFPNHDLVATALTFDSITAGYAHTCALTAAGTAYCWGENADGQLGDGSNTTQLTPVPVSGGLTFSSISAGYYHTCGITTAGAAYCWGKNDPNALEDGGGQLGTGNQVSTNVPTAVVGGHIFRSISGGELMSCGVTTGNIVYCWGDNEFGQLGDGTNISSNSPVKVAGQP